MGHVARREGMHLAAPRGDETAVVVDGLGVRPVDPARAQVNPHLATQGRAGGSVCLAHRIRITPPLLEHPREMREDPQQQPLAGQAWRVRARELAQRARCGDGELCVNLVNVEADPHDDAHRCQLTEDARELAPEHTAWLGVWHTAWLDWLGVWHTVWLD